MSSTSKDQGYQRARIIAIIRQAFTQMTYPGDEKISNFSYDSAEVRKAFQGKRWQDLTDVRFLRIHEDALASFDPIAFRYYLPAFMLAALKDPKTADVILGGLEFYLTPPKAVVQEEWLRLTTFSKSDAMDRFLNRVRGFTSEQKKAIWAYLENFFHDGLEGYWDHFPEKLQQQKNVLDFWDTFAD